MIPTQFGNVPDVALEEIKQWRAQQQQQQQNGLIPTSSFGSISNTTSETISNQVRPTARDLSINSSNGLVRSRSLALNNTVRPSIANPAYQTSLLTTNKQSFLTPTRFGVSRLLTGGIPNNNSHVLPPASSSTSYASNRSLPISTVPNIKNRHTNNHNHHHPPSVTVNSVATTANNDQQRPHYETTYRSSFLKPLVP